MSKDDASTTKTTTRLWPGALVIGAAILLGLGLFWHSRQSTQPAETTPAAPAKVSVAAAAPAPSMPPGAEADAQVLQAAAGLSTSPMWADWLKEGDLARRFVATTSAIAEGLSPRTTLSFLAPQEPFRVVHRHRRTFIDPKSFQRYDFLTDVIGSIDAGAAARAYRTLHPLLDAAYAEIGKPGTTLDGRLAEAIQRIETTAAPREPVEVVATGTLYMFANKDTEALPAANKHLLRMGPRNMKIIQAKLREIADDLHLAVVAAAHGGHTHPG